MPQAASVDWTSSCESGGSGEPRLWHGDFGPAQMRHSCQGYCGSKRFIDDQIGPILETLQ